MKSEQKAKAPISHEIIFKIMLWVTFVTAGVFLLKNVISLNIGGMVAIGLCIIAVAAALGIMKRKNSSDDTREFVLSIMLVIVIMMISLFSGESYSDDFPLYLALIGMTGMYLEPKFTKMQIVVVDIAFVTMYITHPEKAGTIGQYILCVLITNLAAILFYLAVSRGRAFIELSWQQTNEAELLINEIRKMGDELQVNFEASSKAIDESTEGLRTGSDSIRCGADMAAESCIDVHNQILETEQNISALNEQVRKFEKAISDNQENMEAVKKQLRDVSRIITESNQVFAGLTDKMKEVTEIAQKLGDIAFKTKLLSLNASVEAANAGKYGTGFAVVAGEMKVLSENSDVFAAQVGGVVAELIGQVEKNYAQFENSTKAINETEKKMDELQDSCVQLVKRFDKLYDNIDKQNQDISNVDSVFEGLRGRIGEMQNESLKNKSTVDDISTAMDEYRASIEKVIENTRL